jgi:hypothetical protein
MDNATRSPHGIELLVERYRKDFRRPENTEYYTEDDYKEAERKFIKYCLNGKFDG